MISSYSVFVSKHDLELSILLLCTYITNYLVSRRSYQTVSKLMMRNNFESLINVGNKLVIQTCKEINICNEIRHFMKQCLYGYF